MMRGTFANIRIKNEMVRRKRRRHDTAITARSCRSTTPRCVTRPTAPRWSSSRGEEYGTGSSRDWAAKGTNLLGVRAVIVESYERIHRSNLVGMGVLPLQFADGVNRSRSLHLDRFDESFTIKGVATPATAQDGRRSHMTRADGTTETFEAICRIDTANELEYFLNGGILQYVLRKLAS
jgi:aconitate hydratase